MMSLQSATHSSQMKTRGPEMSFRTSRRLFPQNEQWKSSIKVIITLPESPRQYPFGQGGAETADPLTLRLPIGTMRRVDACAGRDIRAQTGGNRTGWTPCR